MTAQHHTAASGSQRDSSISHDPPAAPLQVLWTHSEGSLSSEPDVEFDGEEYAAEDLMQQDCTGESADSDAEAYSEVSARFGGDTVDASETAMPDAGQSHLLAKAGSTPYSSVAAAVLETSLWAVPASSTSGTAPHSSVSLAAAGCQVHRLLLFTQKMRHSGVLQSQPTTQVVCHSHRRPLQSRTLAAVRQTAS